MKIRLLCASLVTLGLGLTAQAKTPDGKPCVLFLAGKPSHGPGEHEHNAGVKLLAKCLYQGAPEVVTKVHLNADWPNADELAQADTIVFYADGGAGHFLLKDDHLVQVAKEMKRGCGFVCLHYAVEFPADKGGPEVLEWMGGYFEANWSVNPHWDADYKTLPAHPVSNGVKPFATNDEWYFHMRFNDKDGKLTHILSAVPPETTMNRKDGPHEGNPTVRAEVAAGKPQTTAWAFERPDGGRGFGFCGGHFHKGWGNDDQRKLVLNAILWTAKVEVPSNGVESKVTEQDLSENLDAKPPRKPPTPATPAPPANADAKPIFTSPLVHDKPASFKVDLTGAKELYLAVTDGGDGFSADWAEWVEPTLRTADGKTIKLTELTPKFSKVGWNSLGVNKSPGGHQMIIGGQPVPFGFGAHAPSLIGFDLPPGVIGFEGRGGIDDGGTKQGNGATVIFKIYTQNPGEKAIASSAAAATPEDRYGLENAKANMSTFTTAPGLKATLFAAEPMIQNPTNIDIDQRGRVWATECVNYRKYMDLRPEGDRVVMLEDTDGDGLADRETTFFQSPELTNPLGICVLPGPEGAAKGTRVIVSAAPWVWLLEDTTGSGKADKATKLFKIGGVWNYDHQVHAFVFGPDGKFYFNAGNSITELMWPDGQIVTDLAGHEVTNHGQPYRGGMVFRCDIDFAAGKAKNVETLAWNFRNNYEVCIDSFGTLWQSDNDDDGNKGVRINYVMQFGNYGYGDELTGAAWQTPRVNIEKEIPLRHWHQNDPGSIPNLLQTGAGSPTGILVNEGAALGAQFTNQLIHCDAGPRTVRAYPVQNDGAGYKATMVDILTSTDSWYRPADLGVAPDGSLYVADWYDAGVGGHGMADHEKGKIMGRIYHVAAEGAKTHGPAPDFSTAAGAVAALSSPNKATQYIAWQKLHELGAAAEPALLTLWKNENPRLRARAIELLARIPGKEGEYVGQAVHDQDANVRALAIRMACEIDFTFAHDKAGGIGSRLIVVSELLDDPSPLVRREAAIALRAQTNPAAAQFWARLAQQHDGKDRWYLEALGIGAYGHEEDCFDAWMSAIGGQWNTAAGRDILWRLRSVKAAGYLAKIIEDQKLTAEEKPRYMRSFDFLPNTPEKTQALIELASLGESANALAAEALTRLHNVDPGSNPGVQAALDKSLAASRGTPRFIEIVRDFHIKNQGQALLDAALANVSDPLANDALKLVLAEPDSGKLLDAALAGPQADKLVTLLGTSSNARTIHALSVLATKNDSPLPRRSAAIQALARTQTGAETILQLARNNELPADLKGVATTALNLVQYPSLKADIATLFPAPAALGGQPLPPMAELVKIKGDAAHGKALFERAESSCVTCHRVNDKGVDFAPALSEIGSKLPKEAIFDAIINPNASISMGFETTQLQTKDGTLAIGIVRSETNEELVLALPGGATNKFGKHDIAKREKLPNSMMPSGLNQALSQQDLVDLVEYLASLKKP